ALRDFTDVRDVVRGYWLAVAKCQPGQVYNICSSRGITFEQILNKLLELSKVKNITLVKDPAGKRPTDGGQIIGDNNKFKTATDWQIEIDFLEQTVSDMLNFWRRQ
ncbi:MAG TPA: GDP-mannose 4,6-dehydratase, partial [Patescibacteria group bacterium]|nr:GDP-mannose 4,6-dehydratase [Patescibacteria group bacterium]